MAGTRTAGARILSRAQGEPLARESFLAPKAGRILSHTCIHGMGIPRGMYRDRNLDTAGDRNLDTADSRYSGCGTPLPRPPGRGYDDRHRRRSSLCSLCHESSLSRVRTDGKNVAESREFCRAYADHHGPLVRESLLAPTPMGNPFPLIRDRNPDPGRSRWESRPSIRNLRTVEMGISTEHISRWCENLFSHPPMGESFPPDTR